MGTTICFEGHFVGDNRESLFSISAKMSEDDVPDTDTKKAPGFIRFCYSAVKIIDAPVTLFKERVLDPIREKNKTYYYHRRFRRVPTIDECNVDDIPCWFEANEQFKRDKLVEGKIIQILRQRVTECELHYGQTEKHKCSKLMEDYELASANWQGKYGDLTCVDDVRQAFMKQKHRMLWERRYGPVGTGMTPIEQKS